MLSEFTNEELPESAPHLSSADQAALRSLETIEARQLKRCEAIKLLLEKATLDELKSSLKNQVRLCKVDTAMHISEELTRRGIAPMFRGLPVQGDSWWTNNLAVNLILLAADLQWVAARYPQHKPAWRRLNSMFQSEKLVKTAEYLHWRGNRSAGAIATALDLPESIQRECAWVQHLSLERWKGRLFKRWSIAQAKIAVDVQSRPWRYNRGTREETIERRGDLWLCAELAKWKPQRTADIYAMKTGEVLARNVVAKQLDKLPSVRRTDQLLPVLDPSVGFHPT
jgi:hypothetical protein